MQKKNIYSTLLAILMLSMLLSIIPVNAWFFPDGTTKYEKFGPRSKKLLIKLYGDDTAEFAALKAGDIDICDWPLSKVVYDDITLNYPGIDTISYGPEFGIFILDVNCNNNEFLGNPQDPTYPNPVYPNPTSDVWLRRAIGYLVDRPGIVADPSIGAGFGLPMYTTIPIATSKYLFDLYGNTSIPWAWDYNPPAANATLDAHHFPIGTDGWRYWDLDEDNVKDAGEEFSLIFYARSDHPGRIMIGDKLYAELTSVRVPVTYLPATSGTTFVQVMTNKNFHLYTGGWSLGVTPDSFVLWSWDWYWHPGFCYDYAGCQSPEFDEAAEMVMYANTQDEAVMWAMTAQWWQAYEALSIPVYCVSGVKAASHTYVGAEAEEADYTGLNWTGIGNMPGYGIDNGATFLNMHPIGYPTGPDMTIRWGFKVPDMKQLNIIYASWLFESNVLGLVYYDALMNNEQYDPSNLFTWACSEYVLDTYAHPTLGECSRVTFTMKPDMYWSDGTPITVADVYFTYVELKQILEDRGLPPPWWYSNVENILSFSILDPYKFEVLLDVKSFWALFWVGGNYILPKHVWKPIAEFEDVQGFAPDTGMIGSGPWRFAEYTEYSHVLLYANEPGSTVTTDLPGAVPVTSPYGYYRYEPCLPDITLLTSKFDEAIITWNVTVTNLLETNTMTIDKTVHIDGSVVASATGVVIAAGATHQEEITTDFGYGIHNVTVTVDYTAGSFSGSRTGFTKWVWVTIPEDISGTTWYDKAGYASYPYKNQLPAPDIKVDLTDVLAAALAFGSFPGHTAWDTVADLNGDHKVDLSDYLAIAINFGWTG